MHALPLHQVSKRAKRHIQTMRDLITIEALQTCPHLWVEEHDNHGFFSPCCSHSQLLPVSFIGFRTVHRVGCCPARNNEGMSRNFVQEYSLKSRFSSVGEGEALIFQCHPHISTH